MVKERFARTFRSLAIFNYRVYFMGQLVSISGTWMQTTAQGWLVLKITNSPAALGTVTLLQFLPVTLLTLFGGVLADRLPKRTVVICTQSVAAIQALVLGLLVVTNLVQLWEIYALALLLGTVNAFDNPTRQALVGELVGREYLQNAIALNSTLFNLARIIGPAIAGVVISLVGIGEAFLINAATFVPVLIGLGVMRVSEFHSLHRSPRGKVLRQVAEGVRYAVNTPDILFTLTVTAVVGTFGYNFSTVLPLLARYTLHAGALGLGILTSALGVGSFLAALVVASARQTSQRVLVIASLVFSVLLLLVGLSSWLPVTLGLLVILGAASIVFSSSANTRLQLTAPEELRGRVLSLYFLLFAGTTPIGGLLVGVLAERIGVQSTIVILGIICLVGVSGALLLRSRRQVATRLQDAPAIQSASGVRPSTR